MCVDHEAKALAGDAFLFRRAPSEGKHFTKEGLRSLEHCGDTYLRDDQ